MVATGDLPLDIEWRLNEKNVVNYPEVSVSKAGKRSSMLTIESVSYLNAGNYTCQATNSAGESVYTTELLVNG